MPAVIPLAITEWEVEFNNVFDGHAVPNVALIGGGVGLAGIFGVFGVFGKIVEDDFPSNYVCHYLPHICCAISAIKIMPMMMMAIIAHLLGLLFR